MCHKENNSEDDVPPISRLVGNRDLTNLLSTRSIMDVGDRGD